jgi:hypothetical protein
VAVALIRDALKFAPSRAVVVDVEESACVRDQVRVLRWAARDAARRGLALHLVHVWCPWQVRLGEALAAAHGMYWAPGEESAELSAAGLLVRSARRVRAEFPGLLIRATILHTGLRAGLARVAEGADSVVIGASADARWRGARISPLCSAVAEASGVPVVQHRATCRARYPVLAVADRLSHADALIQRALIRAAANATSARIMLLAPARADVDQDPRIPELEAQLFDGLAAARHHRNAEAPLSGTVASVGSESARAELAAPASLLMLAWPGGRDIRSRLRRARLGRLATPARVPVALVPVPS